MLRVSTKIIMMLSQHSVSVALPPYSPVRALPARLTLIMPEDPKLTKQPSHSETEIWTQESKYLIQYNSAAGDEAGPHILKYFSLFYCFCNILVLLFYVKYLSVKI